MPSDADAVVVTDLVKRFGRFTAVDGISFTVRRGEIFGFLGPNGAGKSTTIRMLCGIIAPTSGAGRVAGHDLVHEPERVKQAIGYMSQRFSLYPDLTPFENVRFYLGIYERLTGGWVHDWSPRMVFGVAAMVVAIKFGAMWLLMLWRPLRLFLTPAPIRHARVRDRAITCFKVGAERRTHGRTGILIYLSMREHRAEIVADAAIAARVSPEVWGEAMAAMLAHIREDRIADGLVAAIGRVGQVLAANLPRADEDRNELPDRVIEV